MAAKDRRLVWIVVSVVLFSFLLHLLVFLYGHSVAAPSRQPSPSCNAISVFRRISLSLCSANASRLIKLPRSMHDEPIAATSVRFRHRQNLLDQINSSSAGSKTIETITHRSLSPHGYPHYPFVQFSAYRESTKTFFIVGIASSVLRDFDQPVQQCEWRSNVGKTVRTTKADMIYVYYDQFPRMYVVATVNCTFDQDVGTDATDEGGSLFISVSIAPTKGDTQQALAMAETKESASDFLVKRDNPPSWEYAFCGPPIHGSVSDEWIVHWLVYHHHLWQGKAHFFFYDVGGLRHDRRHHRHRQALDRWIEAGFVTIITITDQRNYPSWYHNQLLIANDCLHRTRFLAVWTFFHDLDEFLHIPPPTTLPSLLHRHRHLPYITFGSIWANTSICAHPANDPRELWPVQRLLWMQKQPFCADVRYDPWVCRQWQGSRKYAVNPRKVFAAAVHTPALPDLGGTDLNATIARVYHFHGGLAREASASMCALKLNISIPKPELRKRFPDVFKHNNADFSLSRSIARARKVVPRPLITL